LDAPSERIMKYLSKQHKVPICVVYVGRIKTPAGEWLVCAN
jgi:hypothetical protein